MKARFIPLLAECSVIFILLCVIGTLCPPLLFIALFIFLLTAFGKGLSSEKSPIQKEPPVSKRKLFPNSIIVLRDMLREKRRNKA